MSQMHFSWIFFFFFLRERCRTHILLVHKISETTFHLLLKHKVNNILRYVCSLLASNKWDLLLHLMYLLSLKWHPLVHVCVCVYVCTGWSFVPCSFDPACQSKARADFCVSAIRERRGRVWMVTYGISAEAALWSPEEAWKTNRCLHTSLPVLGVHWQASLQREGTATAACHSAELRIHKPHTHTTRWG